jgi:signal transduction histidine kinase/DNA-binding response OmpR family regulator
VGETHIIFKVIALQKLVSYLHIGMWLLLLFPTRSAFSQTSSLQISQEFYQDSLRQWYTLLPYLEVLPDPEEKIDLQELEEHPGWEAVEPIKDFRHWKGSQWLKLVMTNRQPNPIEPAFLFHNDFIDVYHRDSIGNWIHQSAGKNKALSAWDSQHHTPPFRSPYTIQLEVPALATQTYFIRIGLIDQNATIQPFISNRAFFLEESVWTFKRTLSTQSLFHGVLWVMFLFHLLTFFMYKDKAYLYYSLYILSLSFALIYLFEFDIFLPLANTPGFWRVVSNIPLYGFGIFYSLFLIHFLHEDNWKPVLKKLIRYFIFLQLGIGAISTLLLILLPISVFPSIYKNWLLLPIASIGIVGLLFVSVHYLRSKKGLAKFVATNNFFMIGGLLVSTVIGSVFTGSRITQMWAILFLEGTIILQLISFSLSLGYKGLETERERVKLKELDHFKSRFFANISHEFRTPLTLILGPVQNLMSSLSREADRRQLKMVERNARRLLRLINQILDLSKLEAGKLELTPQEFDYIHISKAMLYSFQSAAREKKVSLSFESDQEQLSVVLDQDKIEQVLINLLSNAMKYSSSGGRIVLKVMVEKKRSGSFIMTSVEDTGIGIDQDQLPHLFKRFYQADHKGFTTQQSSTGIGLALTKELIELHGGNIAVESRIGKGTTFSFSLPLKLVEERSTSEKLSDKATLSHQPIQEEPFLDAKADKTAGPKNAPMVQIIEDNPEIRLYLRSCLEQEYQLIEAADGQKGIDMATQQIPDLIITDVMMPEKDGFEVTEAIKSNEKTSHIPIIILTGKSSRESKIAGLQTSADDYLTKPFDAEELRLRIRNLLSNREKWIARFKKSLQPDSAYLDVPSQEEAFIKKALEVVESNLSNEDFSVEKMGRALLLDRTQLFRKLKAITGQSPSQFIRSIRLKHAYQLLSRRTATVGEIAFSVGFSSTTYFNRCFKDEYGLTPGEVMEK